MEINSRLKIIKIPNLNTIVLKQHGGKFFLTTRDSFIIDTAGFYLILEFLVKNNMLELEVLERIINEHKNR